ncbi:LysM domain-containing protein [Anoxybacillus sp. UARK-01]|uniref:LysM peptidoglycan-binding domain-containing protein n=1 Tax=Anoxybacillus sp. UARK-01 TaxID=1895648 RepID=UPI001119EED9
MSMLIFTISIPLSVHEQGTTTYMVQPEDSLWKIAVRYKVGLSEKMAVNPPFFTRRLWIPEIFAF